VAQGFSALLAVVALQQNPNPEESLLVGSKDSLAHLGSVTQWLKDYAKTNH